MTTQNLYLAYLPNRPPLDNFDVKRQEDGKLLNSEFTFTVIGNSHYIECPELDFYELLSCKPINENSARRLSLRSEFTFRVMSQTDEIVIENEIQTKPLAEFPSPETFDIAYRFAEDAYTTIHCPYSDSYETYHTYPEHDLALYTKDTFYSTLESVPERPDIPTIGELTETPIQ